MSRIPTPSQTVGPFFGFALPFDKDYDATNAGDHETVRIEGTLSDGEGKPISDGLVEFWSLEEFARCRTDEEGSYRFLIGRPKLRSSDAEAPCLDVFVFARGLLRHLTTRIYFPDQAAANDKDPVLNSVAKRRRATLIARHEGAILRFDIRLQGAEETVFFAP